MHTDDHASGGIRTQEDFSCLRSRGHYDRHVGLRLLIISNCRLRIVVVVVVIVIIVITTTTTHQVDPSMVLREEKF
jgi:hypothetical protein